MTSLVRTRIEERLKAYPNLSDLFKGRVPDRPTLHYRVYQDTNIKPVLASKFSFWNILLHDADSEFRDQLRELDLLVARCKRIYGPKLLREGIKSDMNSFLSELEVCYTFLTSSIVPSIYPPLHPGSKRKLDLSVNLEGRSLLVEIITPLVPEDIVRKGGGFAPWDMGLSRRVFREIEHHFYGVSSPSSPVIVIVDGAYSGIGPLELDAVVAIMNANLESTTHTEFANSKARLFVSALIVTKNPWQPYMTVNPAGPKLNPNEIVVLNRVFRIPRNRRSDIRRFDDFWVIRSDHFERDLD